MLYPVLIYVLLALLTYPTTISPKDHEPTKVEIRQVNGKYHLYKDGKPILHPWSWPRIWKY